MPPGGGRGSLGPTGWVDRTETQSLLQMAIPGWSARNAGPQAEGPSQPRSLFSYVKNSEPEKAGVDS